MYIKDLGCFYQYTFIHVDQHDLEENSDDDNWTMLTAMW